MVKPNFFIVGAPKSGTTAMNDYLQQHPDIFMAEKELHYFGSDLKVRRRILKQEYLAHFAVADTKKIIGEASVWYLFSKNAALEIKLFSPEAKILIMLRNPVEAMYAMHSQHLYDGNETVADFAQAIALEAQRRQGKMLPDALDYEVLPSYLEAFSYYNQVKRYFDVFEKENVHVILYEDFAKATNKCIHETFSFLGLCNAHPIATAVINKNKAVRWLLLHRLVKKPSRFLKQAIRLLVPHKQWRHNIMKWIFSKNVQIGKRPELNAALRQSISNVLADDVQKLANLIQRDLSAWLPAK